MPCRIRQNSPLAATCPDCGHYVGDHRYPSLVCAVCESGNVDDLLRRVELLEGMVDRLGPRDT